MSPLCTPSDGVVNKDYNSFFDMTDFRSTWIQMCKPIRPQCAPGIELKETIQPHKCQLNISKMNLTSRDVRVQQECQDLVSEPLEDADRDKHIEDYFKFISPHEELNLGLDE